MGAHWVEDAEPRGRRQVDLSRHRGLHDSASTRIGGPNHRNVFDIGSDEMFQELGRVFEVEKNQEKGGKTQFYCPELDDSIFGDQ
eukprot:1851887-Pyramimonas_sp.AAC.1